MFFAAETLKNLAGSRAAISAKRDELLEAYLTRTYTVPRAKEFAEHGLARRLKSMTICIESVFEILPPERSDRPSIEELTHAVVYIQAFVFNAFGCLDNLAWIWVCEKKLKKDDGKPIPNTKVGLGKTCKPVRRSLPSGFQAHLKSLDEWFKHLEDFRHALAHRIPLYIPPYAILTENFPAYELLEQRKAKAIRGGESLLEAVERVIDGANERRDLARQILLGQADRHGAWSDGGSHLRDFGYRPEGTLNCQHANPWRSGVDFALAPGPSPSPEGSGPGVLLAAPTTTVMTCGLQL